MAKGLFISEEYFNQLSPVDENVNYDLIRPVVWNAQELYIKDIIGSPLYDVIEAEIVSNQGTLTTARLVTLVDTYIAPCLLHFALMDAQITMLYKMRNLSVNTTRSDYADPIEFREHKYLKDHYQHIAEAYAEKIERYLCANTSTYPEYTTYTTSDEVRAQAQSPKVSVFLGGGSSRVTKYGWEYEENR